MKLNKIKEGFDSFLEKRVVPLDIKIIIVIFVLIIAIPAAAFYFLSFNPQIKEINKLENRAAILRKEIKEAKARAAKLDEHLAEMEETKRLFAEASILLPQKKDIPSLLTNISALGTNAGLQMARFKPGNEKKSNFYAQIPISLNISGPYHNIGTFLYEISRLDRIISAVSIRLGSPKMQRDEMILKSNVSLITYRFLEESEIKKPKEKGKRKKKKKKRKRR
ncbi:MAG: type 4a pilus biogenesis protein PilO [Deltaproteobacteria bacterium]|jgi:type IV pilus assembly protein PilO|nr:type 4a pilus biogenesis protein PilO [Deltaproteobacteria bacterium]